MNGSNFLLPTARNGLSITVPRLLRQLTQRDAWLTYSGLLMLALLVPTFITSLYDPRTLEGIGVWVKPMKFQFSVGLYLLTIAWFMGYVRPTFHRSRRHSWLSGGLIIGAWFEVGYITLQGGLGEASHFNISDSLHAALYMLMGLGALMLTALAGWQGVEVARNRASRLPEVLRWSIALGLLLTFVLGAVTGFTISTLESSMIGHQGLSTERLWLLGWSRQAGDLRVAHFVGIHAMHLLPIAGWLLAHKRNTTAQRGLVLTVVGLLVVWLLVFMQALAGQPFLPA